MSADEFEIKKVLQPYLQGDETLRWVGRPRQGLRLSGRDILLIPFSLLWGGFAIFWETTVLASGAPFFFRLWGVPFVLLGLYFIVGRFFVDAYVRRGMVYGLTDRRALIFRKAFGESIRATPLDGNVALSRRGGRGTVSFGPVAPIFGRSGGWGGGWGAWGGWAVWHDSLSPSFQFLDIVDADRVYALAVRSQGQTTGPGR
jgi:hypothetical protein